MKLTIKHNLPLLAKEQQDIEDYFSQNAYAARGLPSVEKFSISLYNQENQLKGTIYGDICAIKAMEKISCNKLKT
jgi:hypothetical protein